MRSITFTPTEADTLAAQRAFMRRYLFSRERLMKGYLPIWWIVSCVIVGLLLGMMAALQIQVSNGQMLVIVVVTLGTSLALIALFLWLTFAGLPRLAKRNYAQQVMLRVEYTVAWSAQGVEISTPRGTMSHVWSDFIKWAEGPETLMLFQSDRAFNFVPKSACSFADLEDIRDTLTAAGVRQA